MREYSSTDTRFRFIKSARTAVSVRVYRNPGMSDFRSAAYDQGIGHSMFLQRLGVAMGTLPLLFAASCSKPGSAETRSSPATAELLPVLAVQKATLTDLSHIL